MSEPPARPPGAAAPRPHELRRADIAGPGELRPAKRYPPIGGVRNEGLSKRDMMAFVSAAIDQNGLVGHNIDGYNDLVQHGLNRIMTQLFDIDRMLRNERTQTAQDRQRKSFQIRFQFHDVKIGRPVCTTYLTGQFTDLMPGRALLTGLPYSGPVTLGATATVRALYEDGRVEEKTAEIPPFQIGGFPVMVGSVVCHTHNMTREGLKELGEDPTNPGGYFVAKRGEYVVDLLENIRYNSVHIHRRMKPNEHVRAEFLSQPGGAFENSSQIRVRYMTNGQLTVEINSTKFEKVRLPFYLIYRLFGMTDDREVAATVVFDVADGGPITAHMLDILERAFQLADAAFAPLAAETNRERLVQMTAERVAKYLTNPTAYLSNDHAIQFLNEDLLGSPAKPGGLDKVLLPHMGQTAGTRIRKLRFLGLLIHKMLLVHLRVLPPTDRDSYRNKRVHGAGVSLAKAFKTQVNNSVVIPIYRAFRRELKNNPWESITDKTLVDTFRNALATSDLNRAMEQAITAGNKTIVVRRRAATNRVSSQALERKNGLNTYSALRTVVTQNAGNASKQTERADMMRRVHPTYVGYICVAQSADTGENVGMRKQLALTAGVCTAGEALPLELRLLADEAVTELDRADSADAQRRGLARLFVNGKWIGYCASAHELVGRYRALRREGRVVDPRTTIAWDPVLDEVEFWLDVGRLTRPLLLVDSNIEEYDAALRARRAWAAKAGGAPPEGGVLVLGAGGEAAGIYFAAYGEYVAFAPGAFRAPDALAAVGLAGADPLGCTRSSPAALVAAGLAARAAPPQEALDVIAAAAARAGGAAAGAGAAPPRVEFVQNTRFTPEHVRGIVGGRLSLDDLVAEGVAEYVAPEEQENCLIAESIEVLRAHRHDVTRRFSHVDVEQAIFGLAAHKPPFGNHTQPARVTYETNQGRQTGGWYVLNFPFRTDKNRFFQFYNEIPLVRTIADKWVPSNGMNTYIAYASYGGDNQEDSAIVCQASADRGLFAGAFFRFEMAELEKGEMFCNPDALTTKNLKPNASYEKLVDGLIRPGSVVRYGDVLIGRVAKLSRGRAGADERYQFTDRSVVYRLREPAVVEAVLRPRGANDELFSVIKLRYERPLRTGDKMSSRSGNKCLTPDHDVLTGTRGWIPIAAVSLADTVACLVDGRLAYARPSEVHEYYYEGPMYEMSSQMVDLCATPNHRMWARPRGRAEYGFYEARDVRGKRVQYQRDAANPQPDVQSYTCYGGEDGAPDLELPMDAWLRLLGMFIGDGYTAKVGHAVHICCIKQRKIDFMVETMNLLGIPGRYAKTSRAYVVTSQQIHAALEPLSVGAIHKRLPGYAWKLSQRQARVLLDALVESDGHRAATNTRYCTSSAGLADDVQRLALHAGWSANIMVAHEAGFVSNRRLPGGGTQAIVCNVDALQVSLIKARNRPMMNHPSIKHQGGQTEAMVDYQGKVHCLTVPGGVFYVRRHKKPVWTGNSIVALMLQQSDMPYTESGLTPDIIINTHSWIRLKALKLQESGLRAWQPDEPARDGEANESGAARGDAGGNASARLWGSDPGCVEARMGRYAPRARDTRENGQPRKAGKTVGGHPPSLQTALDRGDTISGASPARPASARVGARPQGGCLMYSRRPASSGPPDASGRLAPRMGTTACALALSGESLLVPYSRTTRTGLVPTRMTIGQLIETTLGKICAKKGVIADGTAFLPLDHLAMMRELRENGFRYNGRERMYNGMTGEWFDAAIFIGPTAEQRLQKFVLDDEQSVAGSGPTDAVTGQPIGGRLAGGGLRLGEMENWGLESHGSMLNLYEKTSVDSDGRIMNVCRGCGNLAVYNEYHGVYSCRTCGEMADIARVDSSKTAILLHEELAAANIRMRLGLRPREFEERARPGPPETTGASEAGGPSVYGSTPADFDIRGAAPPRELSLAAFDTRR